MGLFGGYMGLATRAVDLQFYQNNIGLFASKNVDVLRIECRNARMWTCKRPPI